MVKCFVAIRKRDRWWQMATYTRPQYWRAVRSGEVWGKLEIRMTDSHYPAWANCFYKVMQIQFWIFDDFSSKAGKSTLILYETFFFKQCADQVTQPVYTHYKRDAKIVNRNLVCQSRKSVNIFLPWYIYSDCSTLFRPVKVTKGIKKLKELKVVVFKDNIRRTIVCISLCTILVF